MSTIEAKSRKEQRTPKPVKMCIHCGKTKELNDFYSNRDWDEQLGRDIWCKECVNRLKTKDEFKEYFFENHREFTEKLWELAKNKAEKSVAGNQTYVKASDSRKKMLLERLTCQAIPGIMQTQYKYQDNTKNGTLTYEEAKNAGILLEEPDPEVKTYSSKFDGYFTKKDLEYLENYYNRLEEDFNFDDESRRDYAKKVCKSSLQADKAQDMYSDGKCEFSDVKDALSLFDMLSKSADFAACKRKTGETNGLSSWSETTYKLETTGHTMQRKIEWEQDDVDKVITSLKHIVQSLGLDSI